MTRPRCPICRKFVEIDSSNRAFPFCSERCKLVDLGNWLGDQYRVTSDAPFDEGDDQIREEDE